MRYCEVLQRGIVLVYRCATIAPRVTRTGTYGPGRAPLRGCTRLYLMQHTQYCHGSTLSNVTLKHTPSQKPVTTDCTVQQLKVYIGNRAPHRRTVLQNGQKKNPKSSPKKRSIMEQKIKEKSSMASQAPPSGESTTTECGVNYQLLAVITEVAQCGTPRCSRPQPATDNGVRYGRSNLLVAPPPPSRAVPPQRIV